MKMSSPDKNFQKGKEEFSSFLCGDGGRGEGSDRIKCAVKKIDFTFVRSKILSLKQERRFLAGQFTCVGIHTY